MGANPTPGVAATLPVAGEARPNIDKLALKARIDEMLNRRPAVGLAAGVVRDGSLEYFHAHGLADIASKTPITEDTVFRIASITKTFTAVAVMQLWERGLIDLDAPASEYLRAYRLIPARASFQPATVRHLLTHTSGAPETLHPWGALRPDFGQGVKAGLPVPSLAEYYRKGLRLDVEPGTRYRYTDTALPPSGRSSKTSAGSPSAATYASTSSNPSAWPIPNFSCPNASPRG